MIVGILVLYILDCPHIILRDKFSKILDKNLLNCMLQNSRDRRKLKRISFQRLNFACVTAVNLSKEESSMGPKELTNPGESGSFSVRTIFFSLMYNRKKKAK